MARELLSPLSTRAQRLAAGGRQTAGVAMLFQLSAARARAKLVRGARYNYLKMIETHTRSRVAGSWRVVKARHVDASYLYKYRLEPRAAFVRGSTAYTGNPWTWRAKAAICALIIALSARATLCACWWRRRQPRGCAGAITYGGSEGKRFALGGITVARLTHIAWSWRRACKGAALARLDSL